MLRIGASPTPGAAALAVALLLQATPPESAAQVSGPLSPEVDALFQPWHTPDSPGAAVLVMKDGEVVHARGYGMANLEHGVPIRTSTVFDIASVSKQFGAMAVVLLEADGAVSLDDEVREYIPELPDFGHEITLRHLVHHTSGLRDWPGTLTMGGWSYEDVISFEQILRMAYRQSELNFPPGEEYAYSNTGYNLLAEVVARVSGMSFREFSDRRIFRPLGMDRTRFQDDHGEVVPDRAQSYRPDPDGDRHRRVVSSLTALGSSSLLTTVEDLARWIRNFDDPVVGNQGVLERMHERGVLAAGDTIAYAFGQSEGEYRGLRFFGHGGSWAGYRSVLQRFPDERFAVVILANTTEMNPSARAREIVDLYLEEELAPRVAEAPSDAAPPETGEDGGWHPSPLELREYEGEYRSAELATRWVLEVRNDELVARHFRSGDRVLRPMEEDRFQASGFGEVRFLRDGDGSLRGFTANSARIRGFRFEREP